MISKHYEFKNLKIRQLLTINDSTKTINMTNLNRIFNDEIFQIFTMLNQIFIQIFKILTIQIAIIKVIKILIIVNITTRTIKLIINKTIKIVNKIQVDT